MKHEISVQDLVFDVDQVPVEAIIGSNGNTRRVAIPGKRALVNQRTGHVLGVVSRDYRVVTNQEAINLAREVCSQAFPGLSPVEWEAKRAVAPRTLSYAFIDLMHRTHVLNYWDSEIKKDDPFTPFLRVTNWRRSYLGYCLHPHLHRTAVNLTVRRPPDSKQLPRRTMIPREQRPDDRWRHRDQIKTGSVDGGGHCSG